MRRWRLPDGRILAELDTSQPQYVLFRDGQRAQSYNPESHSVECELIDTRFEVEGHQLICEQAHTSATQAHRTRGVALQALCALTSDEAPRPAEIQEWLRKEEQDDAHTNTQAEARIAALIQESGSEPGELRRQRERLAKRIVAHQDATSKSLLDVVTAYGALLQAAANHADGGFRRMCPALTRACALATFDPQRDRATSSY
jgi:hypothetical protein